MEDIMNRLTKQCIVGVAAVFGFFALMGVAGTFDYAEQVCLSMPEEVYYTILDTLGDNASTVAVADEYMNNKEYYDNLKY